MSEQSSRIPILTPISISEENNALFNANDLRLCDYNEPVSFMPQKKASEKTCRKSYGSRFRKGIHDSKK